MTRSAKFAFLAVAFITLEILLIAFVDRPVSDWARHLDSTHTEIIDIFRAYTDFGKSKWYLWPAAFGALLCAKACHFRTAPRMTKIGPTFILFFGSIAVSGIITDIIKPILGRARPVKMIRDQIYGFHPLTFQASMNGMPSGHATTAAALATILCYLFPRGKWYWIGLGFALAASRVMVNAHYLSDVLAGSAVGVLTTWGIVHLNQKGKFHMLQCIFPIDKKMPHD